LEPLDEVIKVVPIDSINPPAPPTKIIITINIEKLVTEPIQKRSNEDKAMEPITRAKRGNFREECNFPKVIEQRVYEAN
jgi:hypothetical protein